METNHTEQMLLEAIKGVIDGHSVKLAQVSEEDVRSLIRAADQQKLLPVAVEALHRCQLAESREDYRAYKRAARIQVIQQTQRGLELLDIYGKLKKAGITALVVKGCVCRSVWPKGDLRISADEDIYVRDADFLRACAVFRDCGLVSEERADPLTDFEIGWRNPASTLYIELHRMLFAPKYRELQEFFDNVFDSAREYEVEHGAAKVWSMAPQDHLLYLLLHAYKHFIRSGFGIRQVCDIGLWANRYADEIDHQSLMRDLEKAHALYFAAAVLAIAREDLGIDLQLPSDWDRLRVDRGPMLRDLLDAGVYGASTMSRQHSAPMLQEAVAASREERKRTGLLRRVFPPKEKLLRDYPELKEHPARLPVVWLKRLAKYRKETKNDEKNSALESIRIAREREELLRCYHII